MPQTVDQHSCDGLINNSSWGPFVDKLPIPQYRAAISKFFFHGGAIFVPMLQSLGKIRPFSNPVNPAGFQSPIIGTVSKLAVSIIQSITFGLFMNSAGDYSADCARADFRNEEYPIWTDYIPLPFLGGKRTEGAVADTTRSLGKEAAKQPVWLQANTIYRSYVEIPSLEAEAKHSQLFPEALKVAGLYFGKEKQLAGLTLQNQLLQATEKSLETELERLKGLYARVCSLTGVMHENPAIAPAPVTARTVHFSSQESPSALADAVETVSQTTEVPKGILRGPYNSAGDANTPFADQPSFTLAEIFDPIDLGLARAGSIKAPLKKTTPNEELQAFIKARIQPDLESAQTVLTEFQRKLATAFEPIKVKDLLSRLEVAGCTNEQRLAIQGSLGILPDDILTAEAVGQLQLKHVLGDVSDDFLQSVATVVKDVSEPLRARTLGGLLDQVRAESKGGGLLASRLGEIIAAKGGALDRGSELTIETLTEAVNSSPSLLPVEKDVILKFYSEHIATGPTVENLMDVLQNQPNEGSLVQLKGVLSDFLASREKSTPLTVELLDSFKGIVSDSSSGAGAPSAKALEILDNVQTAITKPPTVEALLTQVEGLHGAKDAEQVFRIIQEATGRKLTKYSRIPSELLDDLPLRKVDDLLLDGYRRALGAQVQDVRAKLGLKKEALEAGLATEGSLLTEAQELLSGQLDLAHIIGQNPGKDPQAKAAHEAAMKKLKTKVKMTQELDVAQRVQQSELDKIAKHKPGSWALRAAKIVEWAVYSWQIFSFMQDTHAFNEELRGICRIEEAKAKAKNNS